MTCVLWIILLYVQNQLSICPTVSLPVCQTRELTKRTKFYRHSYTHERSIHLVFWDEEWLVGDVPSYVKFWVELTPSRFRIGDFQSVFARSASALTPIAKKVRLYLRVFYSDSFPYFVYLCVAFSTYNSCIFHPCEGVEGREMGSGSEGASKAAPSEVRGMQSPGRNDSTCSAFWASI